ncbi:autotransporter domain-containing protein [Fusobacterium varium]
MIEKIMKAVKSSNKRRGRNITIGAVIGFLLSCTAVMGATGDNYLWIKEDSGEIKFSIDGTTTFDGDWKTENPYENTGNIWDKDTKTYTNNIELSSNTANGKYRNYGISYGLRLSGNLTGVNFVNNASIIGEMSGSGSDDGYGFGIYNTGAIGNVANAGEISGTGSSSSGSSEGHGIFNNLGTMGAITNIGIISGTGKDDGSGTGIFNNSGIMGKIENAGTISGIGSSSSGKGIGYGIYNFSLSTMGNIENAGLISGTGSGSSDDGIGSGISNFGTVENIENTGLISGYGTSSDDDGSGTGIYNSRTMGDIENTGLISGSGNSTIDDNNKTGTGIGIHNNISDDKQMGKITNIGIINGYGDGSGNGSGNGEGYGINNESGIMGAITNIGVISGYGYGGSSSNGKGYGINNKSGTNGDITNIGVMSGYGSSLDTGFGYGIHNGSSGTIGTITNTGVIYGKTNAIKNEKNDNITVNNYGILVNGSNNDVISNNLTLSNNYGLTIKNGTITSGNDATNSSVDIAIEYAEDGKVIKSRSMTIKNANIEGGSGKGTSTESIELGSNNYDNYILNGKDETLKVTGSNDKVTGSIINAYGTAVVFEGENKQLTLSGTIVNGGIDNSAAISGSDNADNGDTLILQSGKVEYTINGEKKSATQNTVINGKIDMGDGADTLTIGDGTIINGTLDGGIGEDTLNFGISSGAKSNSSEREGVRILHNISNFENMNINTNVTLFEKTIGTDGKETNLEVTGATEIKIGKNGTLTLRIDSTNKKNLSGIDKIIGHALYENTGEISSTDGGKLLLALNGAGNQSIISFGDTKLNTSLVTAYEGEYYEDVTFGTTSLIHSVKRVNDTENEVEITVKKNLPLKTLKYEKLNKIYHGILSVEDLIANFNVDSNEKLSIFLGYLNDIYAGNPYSYSSELSRKSVGMFRDIAVESQFKPELNKWLIMGGLTHVDGGTKDTYYGKGYYTYDIGSSDMDADTKITGAYMLGEYGVSDTLTYGVLIGGNKLKSNLSNGSKVDGDALYMGAYAKKYIGNLKVTGGLGLQYGDYDADRLAVNKVASSLAEPVMKYSDNYNDMTYDIYLNGRYSHNIGENLFLEPYGTLSYTYIKQDSADEGSKVLAIETDSKSFDYTAAKVGVDIKKEIPHEKGKSTLSAGVSYTRLLTGADEENITGRFKGGSDFDILVAHKNEHSIGLNAKYALELESGILFDVKGSYSVERDSHNGNGKNRNKGEWIVGAGLGYKF